MTCITTDSRYLKTQGAAKKIRFQDVFDLASVQ